MAPDHSHKDADMHARTRHAASQTSARVEHVPRHETPGLARSAVRGGIAGLCAGVLVATAAMLYAGLATPEEAWLPMKNVAATWIGVDALIGAGGTIAVGLLTHFGTSIGWGVIFGLLLGRSRNGPLTLLAGVLWSGVVWIVMTWGILPWLNPTMSARVAVEPYWWWWVLHIIYGVSLAIAFVAIGGARAGRRTA